MHPNTDHRALLSLDLIAHEAGHVLFSGQREAEKRCEAFRNAAYNIAGSAYHDRQKADMVGYTMAVLYGITVGMDITPDQRIDIGMAEIEKRAEMHPRLQKHIVKGALEGVISDVGRERFAHMLFSAETAADYIDYMFCGPISTNYLM